MKKKKISQQESLQPVSDDVLEQVNGGIEVLNAGIGLDQMLPSANIEHLKKTQQLVSSQDINDVKLSALYSGDNLRISTMSAFIPSIETEEVLQPANMNQNLSIAYESLSQVKDQAVQNFVENDMQMMLENQALLQEYLAQGILG